jgi:hypothetical protein
VVKKPEQTQEEWACQGEYRVWSKRYASFYLPLWVKYSNEVAEDCHRCMASHKKSQRIKPLRVSYAGYIANKALLLRASFNLAEV